jgi:hypothetical protein
VLSSSAQVSRFDLARDGFYVPIKQIVQRTDHSRGLVREVIRGQRSDVSLARVRSMRTCFGSTRGGPPVNETRRHSGGASRCSVSAAFPRVVTELVTAVGERRKLKV